MANVLNELKKLIERPLSVAADAGISIAGGVVAYLLFGLVSDALPLGEGIRASAAGIVAAMIYMRARTNLLDPTPAFSNARPVP